MIKIRPMIFRKKKVAGLFPCIPDKTGETFVICDTDVSSLNRRQRNPKTMDERNRLKRD